MVFAANLMHGLKAWGQRFDGILCKSDAWSPKTGNKDLLVYAVDLMHGLKPGGQRFDGVRRKSDAWPQGLEAKI